MNKPNIIKVNHLFPGLYFELITLLKKLAPDQWYLPTSSLKWCVKDIVAHLLDGDLRRISFQRDKLSPPSPKGKIDDYSGLVDFLNYLNNTWVEASKRLSPHVLIELTEYTSLEIPKLFDSLDPMSKALFSVGWAGETKSENWFDIAREYTEKWYHQQQIREAVGEPLLVEQKWVYPLIDTFVRGLPNLYQRRYAEKGNETILLNFTDLSNGTWILKKTKSWELFVGETTEYSSKVEMSIDTAWRMFSKNISKAEARERIVIEGDQNLGQLIPELTTFMK